MQQVFFFGKKCTLDFTISCYEEDGVWKIFEREERDREWVRMEGTESEVFEEFDRKTDDYVRCWEREKIKRETEKKGKPKKLSKRKQMYGNRKK